MSEEVVVNEEVDIVVDRALGPPQEEGAVHAPALDRALDLAVRVGLLATTAGLLHHNAALILRNAAGHHQQKAKERDLGVDHDKLDEARDI